MMKPVQYPSPPPSVQSYSVELTANPRLWGPYFTHDPALFRDEDSGLWYVYSTDMGVRQGVKPGIQIRRSEDLVAWEFVGQAIPEGVDPAAASDTGAINLWTPSIVKQGGEYRLYCAATSFGSQVSRILMAVSESPDGPFVFRQTVLASEEGDPVNAIGPSVFRDPTDNKMYMTYGSYWNGIHILELDPETGSPSETGFGTCLASRGSVVHGSVEGASLCWHDGYYYLFMSCGGLAFDYHVRVARSRNVRGPYKDCNGIEQTDPDASPAWIGTILLAPYRFGTDKGWKAVGAAHVVQAGDEWFLSHHGRPEGSQNYTLLHLRRLVWTEDGWPAVSPERYAGEKIQEIPVTSLLGHYERISLQPMLPQTVSSSAPVILRPDGTMRTGCLLGSWRRPGTNTVHVTLAGLEEKLTVLPAWDWQAHRQTLVMTGFDSRGVTVWYKKTD